MNFLPPPEVLKQAIAGGRLRLIQRHRWLASAALSLEVRLSTSVTNHIQIGQHRLQHPAFSYHAGVLYINPYLLASLEGPNVAEVGMPEMTRRVAGIFAHILVHLLLKHYRPPQQVLAAMRSDEKHKLAWLLAAEIMTDAFLGVYFSSSNITLPLLPSVYRRLMKRVCRHPYTARYWANELVKDQTTYGLYCQLYQLIRDMKTTPRWDELQSGLFRDSDDDEQEQDGSSADSAEEGKSGDGLQAAPVSAANPYADIDYPLWNADDVSGGLAALLHGLSMTMSYHGFGGGPPLTEDLNWLLGESDQNAIVTEGLSSTLRADFRSYSPGPHGNAELYLTGGQSVLDWRRLLMEYIMNTNKDYNWMRPNKRQLWRNLITPALRRGDRLEVVVAVDTSGSMSQEELEDIVGDVSAICRVAEEYIIHVILCDCVIQGHIELMDRRPMESLRIVGGGGTSFEPVFRYIDEKDIKPRVLLYFTDLLAPFPSQKPDYPVIWVSRNATASKPPFGELVIVPEFV